MGLFDKVKKAIGGTPPAPAKPAGGASSGGGQRSGGSGGGNRNRNRNRGGQGGQGQGGQGSGGQRSQGGQRSGGGNRNQRGSERADGSAATQAGEGAGTGSGRRRGSRGGRGRGGQGGNGQARTAEQQGSEQQRPEQEGGSSSSSSSSRRRRRGGRGRGGSGGSGGGQGGSTRTVTRSNAAELKEQKEQDGGGQGGGRSGGSGNRKRSSSRSRGGQGGSKGGSGGGRRRERTRRGSSSSGSHRRVLDANERPKDPVKKQILINASDPNEIRVAIREQQKVVEVYVERKGKRSLAGNIYKGRVQNVLRGMEAAFVDIGLERNGFLYVDEITPAAADSDQIMKVSMATDVETAPVELEAGAATDAPLAEGDAATDGLPDPAAAGEAAAEGEELAVIEPAQTPAEAMARAAADNDETLDIGDAMEEEDREAAEAAASEGDGEPKADKNKGRGRARIQNKKKIQDLIKPGQEILCQVVKDPMGTKGSRLTTQYSLAGRYLVYVPDGEGLGVSRRLEEAERNRLRDIVKQFELPWGGGLIVRTAAEGALEEDIAKDLQLLLRLHEQLMDKAGQARAPKLLYNEADLSLRIIRDLMNDEVEEVLVDDDRQFQRIMNYLKRTSPILAERVRMHDGQRPLFESYGVEEAIKSTLSKRAELVSGGYLIIDKTEAFHVIDVNTGRNVGTASLEETITKTNMEAAEEVVRQLRLRDLGGIIVVDFIDMNLMKNRDMVLEHFRKELSKDRTKTYLVEISPLGLVEMTRQNVSEGVREILTSTCRTCEGRGVTVSAETHAIEVERAVVELASGLGDDVAAVAIETQPDVARVLAGNSGKQSELDRRAGKVVRVFPDPDLTPNTFAVRATGDVDTIATLADPLLRGTKHKVVIDRVDPSCEDDGLAVIDGVLVTIVGAGSLVGEERTILIAACAGERAFATLVKPSRRRRRRGGRGRKKAVAGVGAEGTTELLEDDEAEGDELEDGEEYDDEGDDEADDSDEQDTVADADADDGRTEIPQRLVMFDEAEVGEDDEADDDDVDDDEDEDDVEEDDDDFDDEADGDDDGSDGSDADDDDADEDDGSDDDPDGDDSGSDPDAEVAADDDSDSSSDGDGSIDAMSISDGDDSDDRPLARRLPDDDHDEPSIDAEGGDDLLEARGVSTPAGARPAASANGEATATAGVGPNGQRRRRRGSRGGRNRNRSGAARAEGGSGGAGTGGASGSSTSTMSSDG